MKTSEANPEETTVYPGISFSKLFFFIIIHSWMYFNFESLFIE